MPGNVWLCLIIGFILKNVQNLLHHSIMCIGLLHSSNVPIPITALQKLKSLEYMGRELATQPCTCQATTRERMFRGYRRPLNRKIVFCNVSKGWVLSRVLLRQESVVIDDKSTKVQCRHIPHQAMISSTCLSGAFRYKQSSLCVLVTTWSAAWRAITAACMNKKPYWPLGPLPGVVVSCGGSGILVTEATQ